MTHSKFNDPYRRFINKPSYSETIRTLHRQGLNNKQIRVIMSLKGHPVTYNHVETAIRGINPQYYVDLNKPSFLQLVAEESKRKNTIEPLTPRARRLVVKFSGKNFKL